MLKSVDQSERPLSELDINKLEINNRIKLPESYKQFLLKYNGGVPKQDTFPLPSHREGEMNVHVFYDIDGSDEHLRLQWQYTFHQENLLDPVFADLFPIGHDSFGDPICLDLSRERFGAVIFIDMVPIWKEHTAKDVYVIADSFSAFLDMLYEDDDEE